MPTDWESRYQTGDMPWEKGEPSPGLVDFLATAGPGNGERVLVPGCGTGNDVRAWATAGFAATGLDIAPSAVQIASKRTHEAGLKAEFLLSNFLHDTPTQPFDWIFEHTLYCAIQPEQRNDYLKASLRWLKDGGHYLAVYYLIPDTDGPPFGTTREEVTQRFEPHFEQVRSWVPRSYANRTGLEWMVLWKKRPQVRST